MNTPLRFIVIALVILSFVGTATALQLHLHRQTRAQLSELPTDSAARPYFLAQQTYQQRIFLLIVAAGLGAIIIAAITPSTRIESNVSLKQIRAEMSQMDRLARTTVGQAEALARERDARLRTEENLNLNELRLNQALEQKIRLGRDLHDGIIQSLYATGLILESARQKRAEQPAEADALIEKSIGLLNTTIGEVRGYIHTLSAEVPRDSDSFISALNAALADLHANRPVDFNIHIDDTTEAMLDNNQRRELLQITREAASNALRHGKARCVTIRLHEDGARIALLIQDDGAGFDPSSITNPGMGLANLRARTKTLAGDFRITSQSGQGARVIITFPSRPLS
jgi:signal transduction histidine kinase